jgi:hypothetical protein
VFYLNCYDPVKRREEKILRSNKEISFVCDALGNNQRAFSIKIVMVFKPSVDSIYSTMTSEIYFSSTIDIENKDSISYEEADIIPGTVFSKTISVPQNKELVNCWVFCDLHQKDPGTIVKKLQIGRFRKCQVKFLADSTQIEDLELRS